jgi:hypothetical protein
VVCWTCLTSKLRNWWCSRGSEWRENGAGVETLRMWGWGLLFS